MIALPMVLAKIGLIPSFVLTILIWAIMYYTSLINLDLNLKADKGLPLGALGRLFSGRGAELVGGVSLKLLSYALLAVFIYAGSSVVQKLLELSTGHTYQASFIGAFYGGGAILLLLLPLKLIDYINRLFFMGMVAVFFILMGGLVTSINWSHLPLITGEVFHLSVWSSIIPVVFTSFGFQVIFHTLTNYCQKDALLLKRVFFWGSLIPVLVYMMWTWGVLSVVYHDNPAFYHTMSQGGVDVGDLIEKLSTISHWTSVQLLVWCLSLLAILTSVIGVGVGLADSLKSLVETKVSNPLLRRGVPAMLSIIPAYLVAIWVPHAFIKVLGFAGMILVVIAILLPIYLLYKARKRKLHYPQLKATWLIALAAGAGLFIIGCEVFNMLQ
jgi:tyrosine-specific transport protein